MPVVVRGAAAGFEIIFQGKDWGRLYSTGMIGSVGKSFMSSGSKGMGGGQVVLRGWDAVREWKSVRPSLYTSSEPLTHFNSSQGQQKKGRTSPTTQDGYASSAVDSDCDDSPAGTPTPRSRTTSASSPTKPSPSTGLGSSFLSSLRTKMGGASSPTPPAPAAKREPNSTEEAMEGPRKKEDGGSGESVGEVDELVLVIHGIGQQLAATYESFNFVSVPRSSFQACRRALMRHYAGPRRQLASNGLHDAVHGTLARAAHPLEASPVHSRQMESRPQL